MGLEAGSVGWLEEEWREVMPGGRRSSLTHQGLSLRNRQRSHYYRYHCLPYIDNNGISVGSGGLDLDESVSCACLLASLLATPLRTIDPCGKRLPRAAALLLGCTSLRGARALVGCRLRREP